MRRLSNCWLAARIEYERRCWRWRRDPINNPVPYMWRRPCFVARGVVDHHGVGRLDEQLDAVLPSSFGPDPPDTRPLRWWQVPLVVVFRGRWSSGEARRAAEYRDRWITGQGELGEK